MKVILTEKEWQVYQAEIGTQITPESLRSPLVVAMLGRILVDFPLTVEKEKP